MNGRCSFCLKYQKLTKHHLIPKSLHTKLRKSKKYKIRKLKETVTCCRDCHDLIHENFTRYELERRYNTFEKLNQALEKI